MKILLFGRGVVSTATGWALEQAGHTVEFYVRPGRAAEYGSHVKLDLLDARKRIAGVNVRTRWPVSLREELPETHDYDLIIVSVQHYRFAEAAAFLATRVSNATLLVFNNFFVEPLAAAAALPKDKTIWGFPAAGGGFQPDGSLEATLMAPTQFGTFGTEPSARDDAVREVFRQSGFNVVDQRDFRGWLFVHFATNAGLHAQTLKVGSMIDLAKSPRETREAFENVRELLPLVAARGVDLSQHRAVVAPFRLPALGATAFRWAVKLNAPLRRVLESHSNPEELRVTCRDALDEARRLQIPTPRLAALERYFR